DDGPLSRAKRGVARPPGRRGPARRRGGGGRM
ncbi:MAG: hypothetical protein AVDCRST_MAG68-5630, partial [uncultured Gemmatimonadetes bacterium]